MSRGRASYASWEGRTPPAVANKPLVARGDGVWTHDTFTDADSFTTPRGTTPHAADKLLSERDRRIDELEEELRQARNEIESLKTHRPPPVEVSSVPVSENELLDYGDELTRPRPVPPSASQSAPTRVAPPRPAQRSRPSTPSFAKGGTMLMAPSALLAEVLEEDTTVEPVPPSMAPPKHPGESPVGTMMLDVVPALPPAPSLRDRPASSLRDRPALPLPPKRSREFDLPSFAEQSSSGARLPLPPEPNTPELFVGPVSLPPPSSWVPPAPRPKSQLAVVMFGLLALFTLGAAASGYAFVARVGPFARPPSSPKAAEASHADDSTPREIRVPLESKPTDEAAASQTTGFSTSAPVSSSSAALPSAIASSVASAPAVEASALPSVASVDVSKLLSFQGFLIVHSAAAADVVVQGVPSGPTNEPLLVRCGPKNVRLRTITDWITEGQHVQVECMKLTEVTIPPAR